MADDPPHLQLASSKSEEELVKERAIAALAWPTREMAANLLRVIRGAGRPQDLPQQIIDLAGLILEAAKHSNAWGIWSEMEQWLQEGVPDYREYDDFEDHLPTVVRGSLQITASRLVGQRTQVCAGESEVADGIREREDFLERRRRKREEEWKAQRAAERANKPKKTPAKRAASRPFKAPPKAAPPKSPVPTEIEKLPGESTFDFMKRCKAAMDGGS